MPIRRRLASACSRVRARSFGVAAASQSADWLFPVPTHFGPGRAAELPSLLAGLGASRPLLVTDEALGATPLVARLVASLREAGVVVRVFDEVKANPTDVNVRAGAAAFRAHGADSLVAVGGGSGLDAGKLIAMVANTGLDLLEVEWTVATPAAVAPGAIPPVITVPTTAGTGAEMDSASMYTDTAAGIKRCACHPACAVTVLADPELTLSLPPHLTAWTGMDALTHALEALFVDAYHPMCDAVAIEAARAVRDWLGAAYARGGTDVEARSQMMAASSMAAVAFQKGLGATHGLSEPLGAVYDVQHGLANAVLLPYVLVLNRHAIEGKCALLARALQLPTGGAGGGDGGDAAAFDAVLDWVLALGAELRIPRSLAEIGISADLGDAEFAAMGAKAAANPTGSTNPVALDAADYEKLFRAALAGTPPREFSLL